MERLIRIKGLIVKEGYQIVRDPSNILIAFVLPMLLLLLFGYAISLDQNTVTIGVVVEDTQTSSVNSFIESLQGSRYFDIKTIKHDRREVVPLLVSGDIRGMVIIPENFSQNLQRTETLSPIQVITDGSEPNTAKFVENYVAGAWLHWLSLQSIGQPLTQSKIQPEPRYWFNEELNSHFFLVPSSIVVILTIIGALLTALVIAREWERGTMEALMSTPVSILDIMIGKLIPYYFLGLGSMLVCLFASDFIFEVPMRGSFWVLFVSSSAYLFATLSMGLFVSTVAKSQFVAAQIALIIAFLPSFLLSGFLYEISSMPTPIQWITYVVPARYFVSILKTIFMAGDIWYVIVPNILSILAIMFVFLFLTIKKSHRRLD